MSGPLILTMEIAELPIGVDWETIVVARISMCFAARLVLVFAEQWLEH